MLSLLKKLYPIYRSITGMGNRKTLYILKKEIPKLKINEIKSGTKVFDWVVPPEWNVKNAYVLDSKNNKIIDFKRNNLHLVSYSIPVNKKVDRKELLEHLHSLQSQPNAIPYVTSYYNDYWGFCVTHKEKKKIQSNKSKNFQIVIDSSFKHNGSLTFGEFFLKGKTSKEILISTYICHPSMANNELSGPVVATYLIKYFQKLSNYYSIRFLFLPETIGSIAYISKNIKKLKKNVIAGYVLTCIGDNKSYSFLPTKYNNTLSDRAATSAFKNLNLKYKTYSFLERGSDERQYNSPGIDLPIASLMRTKYGEYKEYHTSLDNLSFVSEEGLLGGYNLVKETINILMINRIPKIMVKCEPQLGKRGLYSQISTKKEDRRRRNLMNFITYADGTNDLIQISIIIGVNFNICHEICSLLEQHNLVKSERKN